MADDKSKDKVNNTESMAEKAGDAASKQEKKTTTPKEFSDLVKKLDELSALQMSQLVKHLEEHWQVSAATSVTVAASPGGGESTAPAEDEKSEYDVVLKDAGSQKVAVIKAVKEASGLGLGEAKAIVDSAPKPVKEKVSKEEAEEIKKALEAAGATVELV